MEAVYARMLDALEMPEDEMDEMIGDLSALPLVATPALPARVTYHHWQSDPLSACTVSGLCAAVLCTSSLERLCELEGFLTTEDRISERHFDTISRHLHSLAGNTAMFGLETLSSAFNELDQSLKRAAEEPSSVSGVTHSHPVCPP